MSPKDTDGDGIPDDLDSCPNEPEDRDGYEDHDGCPDPDNDHDGVPDVLDKCPNEPEPGHEVLTTDGCPPHRPGRVYVGPSLVTILDNPYFDRGKTAPNADSQHLLGVLAGIIQGSPQLLLIEVQGHASPDERHAEALSLARAVGARDALVALGVSADRLVARDYGAKHPWLCGKGERGCGSAMARVRSRRVDFRILKRSDGPPEGGP